MLYVITGPPALTNPTRPGRSHRAAWPLHAEAPMAGRSENLRFVASSALLRANSR